MNIMKKISMAIIYSPFVMTDMLSDFCSGHIKLSEENKKDLEKTCDIIIEEAQI